MPGIVLGAGDIAINKTYKDACLPFMELTHSF